MAEPIRCQRSISPAGPREPILRSLILKRFRSIPAETVQFANPTFLDQDDNVRSTAAWAMGVIGGEVKAGVPALVNTLEDKNVRVRRAAAEALANFGQGAKAAVPALIDALKDRDGELRYYSAFALGMIGSDAKIAVPALMTALKDSNEEVRNMAKAALEQIDPTKRKTANEQ